MKTLLISPSWLGDLIMAQSLFKVLKQQDPEGSLTVYAPKYLLPLLERMREVDDTITNPFAHGEFNLTARWADGRRLRQYGFDRVFVLPNSLKSALPAWFAGIPERIGFKGESRYLLLNRMRKDKDAFPRMVERYVALAYPEVKSAPDLPSFDYPSLEVKAPSPELLERLGLDLSRPLLTLGCGANYGPAKLWPPEYFAKVCEFFIRRGGAVLGSGTKKDTPTVHAIMTYLPEDVLPYFHDISGKTSLTEALDLTGASAMAVCNDSGMMHTVAAAGLPQVCIFGSTSTGYTPPLSDKAICLESDEPCHPCFERTCRFGTYACLKKLTPEMVIAQMEKLLS
ncbi:MAG TPA: lipopolysaccharide heptosyltransferase II [Candidatus Avisuccinivibrio pullicola]|nr:lipopolysaccharide heptosyltransferase II [Candidatus Avisuccinivibrio pullicola]